MLARNHCAKRTRLNRSHVAPLCIRLDVSVRASVHHVCNCPHGRGNTHPVLIAFMFTFVPCPLFLLPPPCIQHWHLYTRLVLFGLCCRCSRKLANGCERWDRVFGLSLRALPTHLSVSVDGIIQALETIDGVVSVGRAFLCCNRLDVLHLLTLRMIEDVIFKLPAQILRNGDPAILNGLSRFRYHVYTHVAADG